jgi:hypothetical protein
MNPLRSLYSTAHKPLNKPTYHGGFINGGGEAVGWFGIAVYQGIYRHLLLEIGANKSLDARFNLESRCFSKVHNRDLKFKEQA